MPTEKVPLGTRIPAEAKAEGERRAAEERRSFASYLEWLIMKDGEANPPPEKAKPATRKR